MIKDDIQEYYGINPLDFDTERTAHNFANNFNVGRSGFVNDTLLVSAGIMIPWNNCGIAWALLGPQAKNHHFFVFKAISEGLFYFTHKFKLRRIEANVESSLEPAKRLVKHLGFVEESIMPKYGPKGETFIKYVILR